MAHLRYANGEVLELNPGGLRETDLIPSPSTPGPSSTSHRVAFHHSIAGSIVVVFSFVRSSIVLTVFVVASPSTARTFARPATRHPSY